MPGVGYDVGRGKMSVMENFREFQAGPDPFGRTWQVRFKYLQTAISIRHSDSVDVTFVMTCGEESLERTVVIQHVDLRDYGARSGRPLGDPWCSRVAMLKLTRAIVNAEGLDLLYLPVTRREMEELDADIKKWEDGWIKAHAA